MRTSSIEKIAQEESAKRTETRNIDYQNIMEPSTPASLKKKKETG